MSVRRVSAEALWLHDEARREDALRCRRGGPGRRSELAGYLRIEERELEAAG